jgi:hypothetical protein
MKSKKAEDKRQVGPKGIRRWGVRPSVVPKTAMSTKMNGIEQSVSRPIADWEHPSALQGGGHSARETLGSRVAVTTGFLGLGRENALRPARTATVVGRRPAERRAGRADAKRPAFAWS